MLKYFICLLTLLLPWAAQAKLYKVIDESGSITYTDIAPNLDAKEYKLEGINAINNPEYNMEKLSMVIPYVDENGAMIVQGSVNGIAMRFVVDTGATLLAIPPVIAKRAGLYDVSSTTVIAQTANGQVNVPRVNIKRLTIAKIKQTNIDATIQSVSTKDPELGLLGMSFFHHYKMNMDHVKKEIRLERK